MKILIKICVCIPFLLTVGCKKLVEIDSPVTTFDASKIYNKDANAIAVLTAMYQEMSADGYAQGVNSIAVFAGLSADELIDYPGFSIDRTAAYQNRLTSLNAPFWGRLYFFVYTTNTAIEGIMKSETLSPHVKQRLLGEAKFMRAFFYFYLVNFWGDVPLPITKDYVSNRILSRSKKDQVYGQILDDLKAAEGLLGDDYVTSDLKTQTEERIRPNKWVAKAFLARVLLYIKEYSSAEQVSTEVIDQTSLFSLAPLNDVFLNTSKEAIWQIQAIDPAWNTEDAKAYILNEAPNISQPVSLSNYLIESFEAGDNRRSEWVKSITVGDQLYYYAYKYKVNTENAPKTESMTVLRLAEQYLIRAESRNESGKVLEAIFDINEIRSRARMEPTAEIPNPLPPLFLTLSKEQVRLAIMHERQVELFTEWGHRWFDLKRSGLIDATMSKVAPSKETTWDANMALYPIPQDELLYNYNMTQNPGY